MKNPFKDSERDRKKIVEKQKREIKKLYKEAHDEIKKEVEKLKSKNDTSSVMRKKYLNSLKKEINSYMEIVDRKTESIIKNNMDLMVLSVFQSNQMYLTDLGFNFYSNNPMIKKNVVNTIMNGKLYGGKWSLSKAIWGDNALKQKEISRIVSKGIIQNKGVYNIAKDLERYLNPNARKKDSWLKSFPGSRRKIDYNAQRLARTMVSHAYEESFVRATINNPFIEAYQWITSGGHNVCTLCMDRELSDRYGLGPGVFPKDKLPLDHPNGMCTFDIIVTMSDQEIIDAVADWYYGEGDQNMNEKIDFFVNDLKNF